MQEKLSHPCGSGMNSSGITPPSEDRSRSSHGTDYDDPDLAGAMVPAMSVVRHNPNSPAPGSDATPVRRMFVSEPSSSEPAGTPDPTQNLPAAAFVAGAAVQRAHHASDVALQAAEHAQQQQLLAEQARREAGELREAAQQREGLFRHQAMNLVTQAQQAVSYAREHEFNARQQAIGAAEQEEATRQQAEVLRLQAQTVVSEAHQEVGQTRALAERYAAEVRNRANAEQAQAQAQTQYLYQEAQRAVAERDATILALQEKDLQQASRLAELERTVSLLLEVRQPPTRSPQSAPQAQTDNGTDSNTPQPKRSHNRSSPILGGQDVSMGNQAGASSSGLQEQTSRVDLIDPHNRV